MQFDVELSGYGLGAAVYDVERVTDGMREDWLGAVRLPRRERMVMAPLSVVLVDIMAH